MSQPSSNKREPTQSFLDQFEYKIFSFARAQGLLENRDRIIVSISGGIDSVSLFHLLYAFRKKIDIQLHLVHFHHGLRKASDDEELFIRDLSQQMNVPLTVKRSTDFKNKKGMQNLARQWRQEQLDSILSSLDYNKVALGHHLDDLVETQIWRLIRGASLFSLNPIQAINPPYIRPLLHTPKKDLVEYLKGRKLEWKEDHSNRSDEYTRNLIRNRLMPIMKDFSGGKLLEKMLALNNDAVNLKSLFEQLIPKSFYENESIPYELLSKMNPLIGCELIHRFLLFNGQDEISRDNIQRIFELVQSGKGNWSINLKEGVQICGRKKIITLIQN